ncbi:uncharacterized protein BT62DRAFT_1079800 [Guyanagaster necrorhizus]|uniref:Uncharacterized protein n=1 Tax=Guyanagaster necrorhizus TaxID=856835 RepID=A0A9P7VJN5_9AGAR|nr:uncharacterized protein BT62DRAFT_1079800 [Guyanagaster necrorhizus MCA 3950]KAG7441857.1 hypothetical protein BT62DRAFT_1079800 [Guyanagaster necrorhizus MCA 3950]
MRPITREFGIELTEETLLCSHNPSTTTLKVPFVRLPCTVPYIFARRGPSANGFEAEPIHYQSNPFFLVPTTVLWIVTRGEADERIQSAPRKKVEFQSLNFITYSHPSVHVAVYGNAKTYLFEKDSYTLENQIVRCLAQDHGRRANGRRAIDSPQRSLSPRRPFRPIATFTFLLVASIATMWGPQRGTTASL